MANKAHKNLTGVDLHEPKGIASATSGQHYIADGLGSGVWSTVVIPTGTFYVTVTTFTASGTWTKPANLFVAKVHVQAEGGGIPAGTHHGGSASFGSHCSATGGDGAVGSTPGVGGTGSSGSLNLSGTGGSAANGSTDAGSYYIPGGLPGGPFPTKGCGSSNSSTGGSVTAAGGGGGYSMKWITTSALGTTETITIAATGAANAIIVVEEFISV